MLTSTEPHPSGFLTLIESTIDENTANDGAGIHCDGCTLELDSTYIAQNTAVYSGGGLLAGNGAAVHTVGAPDDDPVEWRSNHAAVGGGIHLTDSVLTADLPSRIRYNVAERGAGVYLGVGAHLTLSRVFDLGLFSHTIFSNDASGTGALDGGGGLLSELGGTYDLEHVLVADNTSALHGGGVLDLGAPGPLGRRLDGIRVYGNEAVEDGGFLAMYDDANLVISDSQIGIDGSNNEDRAERGGLVFMGGSAGTHLQVLGPTEITRGRASTAGSGVFVAGPGVDRTLVLEDVNLHDNHASFNAGAAGMHAETGQITLRGRTHLSANRGVDGPGGAWFGPGVVVTLEELGGNAPRFDGNVSQATAGALVIEGATVTGRADSISDNTTQIDGGAVRVLPGSFVALEGTTFAQNSTYNAYAGALQLVGGAVAGDPTFACVNCSFLENTAHFGGGAIHASANTQLDLTDPTFADNRATLGDGGAILLENAVLQVFDNDGMLQVWTRNEAENGAVIDAHGSFVHIEGVSIDDNSFLGEDIDHEGGAIRAIDSEVELVDVTVQDNGSAGTFSTDPTFGGGLFLAGDTRAELVDCMLSSNEASERGGGILMSDGYGLFNTAAVSLVRSAVTNNRSGDDGAGIACLQGKVTLREGTSVHNNWSDEDGGGVYTAACGLDLLGTEQAPVNITNNRGQTTAGIHRIYSGLDTWSWVEFRGNNPSFNFQIAGARISQGLVQASDVVFDGDGTPDDGLHIGGTLECTRCSFDGYSTSIEITSTNAQVFLTDSSVTNAAADGVKMWGGFPSAPQGYLQSTNSYWGTPGVDDNGEGTLLGADVNFGTGSSTYDGVASFVCYNGPCLP